ncbi:hypothetical protein [Micromonospora sp. KC721]|uniref:hypothetical protein n=1 Tax=Micromonospora sp. KC721 TaxID=2530380 RepID=UPI00104DD986|nr:hypothetical protein [Micromonospora sp. KC721]TDB81965.1 hypothetical protein E1182_03250 [Micromonospora sp. KC721]
MTRSPNRPGPASALRFATELVAWVATPWALAGHSVLLAVASVVVLVALPTVFATPGDKEQVLVPVPGQVTIGLVLLHMAAAAVASWLAWPLPAAITVWILVAASVLAELPRWRWLICAPVHATV